MTSPSVFALLPQKSPPNHVLIAYTFFFGSAFAIYHIIANGEFSSILTLAVMMQCLAFVFLLLQALFTSQVTGISARALGLDALALVCRLSSTTWLNGYLPVDASGDWLYQVIDVCSLIAVCWLLKLLLLEKRGTYQQDEDTFPIAPMALGAFVLAAVFHADMNARPLFDTLWMTGLFVSVVAVLPQLWLIARSGGRVEALTSHYIAAMAVSRALSGTFMWHARFDITCAPWIDGVNHAIWIILAAHVAHMLMLGDFAYYYVRAVMKNGFTARLEFNVDDCGV